MERDYLWGSLTAGKWPFPASRQKGLKELIKKAVKILRRHPITYKGKKRFDELVQMNQEHMDPISLEFKFVKRKTSLKMNFLDVTEPREKHMR